MIQRVGCNRSGTRTSASFLAPPTLGLLIGRFAGIYPVAVHVYRLREIWREAGQGKKVKKKKRKSRGSSRSFCEIIGTTTGAPNVDTGKNRRRLLEKYLVNCADSRNPPGWHLLDQCVIGSKAKVTLLNRKLWSHDHKWLEWIVL